MLSWFDSQSSETQPNGHGANRSIDRSIRSRRVPTHYSASLRTCAWHSYGGQCLTVWMQCRKCERWVRTIVLVWWWSGSDVQVVKRTRRNTPHSICKITWHVFWYRIRNTLNIHTHTHTNISISHTSIKTRDIVTKSTICFPCRHIVSLFCQICISI